MTSPLRTIHVVAAVITGSASDGVGWHEVTDLDAARSIVDALAKAHAA